jgi:pimeloyl-ACP methyl ester carboxylesterase
MDQIKIIDLNIAFERKGRGQPLVLLHGALVSSKFWRKQMDELSKDFTVVAWDAPGCGLSDDPPQGFLLSDYADYLAEFIQRLGLNLPHVLGLSFGGGLAIELYHRHPEIPKTLILASAYAGWAGSLPPKAVKERLEKGIELSKTPPDQLVDAFLPTLFTESSPAEAKDEMAKLISEFHPDGMRIMLRAFAKADLRHVLPTIHVPTLLLYGEVDQRSPHSIAESLHTRIPSSKLVFLPDVGHVGSLEAPEAFNREVRNFLNSLL